MADSNYERFKKRYKKVGDIPVLAVPPPVPGPGGIGRYLTGRVVQEGVKAGRKLLAGEGAATPNARIRPSATTTRAGVGVGAGAALTAGGYYAAKEMQRRDKANASQGVDRSSKGDREIVPIKMIEKERLRKIQAARAAQKPKLRPVAKAGKSATRIAFEKEFAKKRAEAKRRGNPDKGVFTFRGKRYNTKLAK